MTVAVATPGTVVAGRGCKGAATGARAAEGCVDDAASLGVEMESFAIAALGVGTGLAGGNSS